MNAEGALTNDIAYLVEPVFGPVIGFECASRLKTGADDRSGLPTVEKRRLISAAVDVGVLRFANPQSGG